ncbi:MAG: hypothetical protein MSH49_09685 [[Eubacterium] saphenum]|nr:hypothetical protein [[Eubacterium] saphenum]
MERLDEWFCAAALFNAWRGLTVNFTEDNARELALQAASRGGAVQCLAQFDDDFHRGQRAWNGSASGSARLHCLTLGAICR